MTCGQDTGPLRKSPGTHDRKTADRTLADVINQIENKEAEVPGRARVLPPSPGTILASSGLSA